MLTLNTVAACVIAVSTITSPITVGIQDWLTGFVVPEGTRLGEPLPEGFAKPAWMMQPPYLGYPRIYSTRGGIAAPRFMHVALSVTGDNAQAEVVDTIELGGYVTPAIATEQEQREAMRLLAPYLPKGFDPLAARRSVAGRYTSFVDEGSVPAVVTFSGSRAVQLYRAPRADWEAAIPRGARLGAASPAAPAVPGVSLGRKGQVVMSIEIKLRSPFEVGRGRNIRPDALMASEQDCRRALDRLRFVLPAGFKPATVKLVTSLPVTQRGDGYYAFEASDGTIAKFRLLSWGTTITLASPR